MIGVFFMSVVIIPVISLLGAFVLEKPRDFRVPALFFGAILGLLLVSLGVFALFSILLGNVIP